MSLLGDRAWWLPRWLDRALPNVDIEGEGLRAHLEEQPVKVDPADRGIVVPGRDGDSRPARHDHP